MPALPPTQSPIPPITFLAAWKRGWTRWEWDGRTSRREYRLRTLSWLLEITALFALAAASGAIAGAAAATGCIENPDTLLEALRRGFAVLWLLYALAQFLQRIGLTVRRLHDAGYSGWWWFLNNIPFGSFVLLFSLLLLPGERGLNAYGPDPTLPLRPLRNPFAPPSAHPSETP